MTITVHVNDVLELIWIFGMVDFLKEVIMVHI